MASTTTDTAAEVPTTSDVIVQYVVLRRDLIDTWPLGSVVTQGCHASVAAIWAHKDDPQTVEYCSPDKIDSMHKVTLEVKGEVQLKNLSEKLTSNNIDHKLWIEQPENYPTCLATKPYPKSLVSTFFKKLKLYMVQEDEDEDVQEVDVRGKKIGTKKPRENWPPEQEVALAKAWIQVSECKKFGKEQKPEGFWKRVFEHYATTLGSTSRTFHGLNTKWKTMNAAMVIFNGYYLQAKRAKASGCNDMDVMKVAFADYQTKTKKQFSHMLAWEVVKDHAKWVEQDCFQEIGGSASNSLKRKPGEYESTCNENIIPDMIEDQIPPFDSTKSKKKQGASSSSVSSVADDISSYTQRKREYLDEKRERDKLAASLLATQLDGVKFKNRQREMKFFFEPHDHITDPVYLEVILADKREIAKKNGWRCDF